MTQERGESESFRNKPRWSANKKTDAVMRLLRCEALDVLIRELQIEAQQLAKWRDEFLEGGKDRAFELNSEHASLWTHFFD